MKKKIIFILLLIGIAFITTTETKAMNEVDETGDTYTLDFISSHYNKTNTFYKYNIITTKFF